MYVDVVSPVIVVALLLRRRATANAKSVDILRAQWASQVLYEESKPYFEKHMYKVSNVNKMLK